MKETLRNWVERTDTRLHRLGWTPEWLCALADLSYGVPVDSFGHPDKPREQRLAPRTSRLLWRLIGD